MTVEDRKLRATQLRAPWIRRKKKGWVSLKQGFESLYISSEVNEGPSEMEEATEEGLSALYTNDW